MDSSSSAPTSEGGIPAICQQAVLVGSSQLPDSTPQVVGYDINQGADLNRLLDSYVHSGFQATNFGLAEKEITKMLEGRNGSQEKESLKACKIFLGYTSNMISSGLRETIRFLVQHRLVDCIVTSAGGVEEDLIKCLAPTHIGDFHLKGADLRSKGLNRIGNLLVPNNNYCKFEDWLIPILNRIVEEQRELGVSWTPSKLIERLGSEIDCTTSVCYWAQKNKIPIFCPGLTDGSIGDMLYFHSYKNPGLKLDIIEDVRKLNDMAVWAERTGMIILGGGLIKHHICNANLMRNGADYAVFINTGQEFDGSDSGARPDEAVSWGKIKATATPVKLYADATLVFPLIVARTFAKYAMIS